MKRALVAVPFLLILVLTPYVAEGDNPYHQDGVFLEPWIEDVYEPPKGQTEGTTLSLAGATTGSADGASIKVSILLALDEEFYIYYYWTPHGIMNGFLYAQLQIRRASSYFEATFDVELVVVKTVTWHKDETDASDALVEVIRETGFYSGMQIDGVIVEALIAYTVSELVEGGVSYSGATDDTQPVAIIRYLSYWSDENIIQHEVSHLMNAEDGWYDPLSGSGNYECYASDCIMSYRLVYVETIEEDGVVWDLNTYLPSAFVYNDWCSKSYGEVNEGKASFLGNDECHGGDC